ncbi:MAG: hypothetical protein IPN16_13595 [Gemmatimonadetes bacterium]|nr:hypothetical protein [Gemmatimonadota bacterium]
MRWWPSSLRARLALWFTIVLGVPLVAFAIVSYVVFDRTLLTRTDHFVEDALSAFARELANERRMAPTSEVAARTTVHEVRFAQLQVVIADRDGRVLASSAADDAVSRGTGTPDANEARALAAVAGVGAEAPAMVTLTSTAGAWRVHARRVTIGGEPLLLAGIASLRDIETCWRASVAPSSWPSRSCSPRPRLAATSWPAARCRRLGPWVRAPPPSPTPTCTSASRRHATRRARGLAVVINSLLDRPERAFAQQRRFMADASHELRTPAAILNTEAQVTLSRPQRPRRSIASRWA